MKVSDELRDALKEHGYSGAPIGFWAKGVSGQTHARVTNFSEHRLRDISCADVIAMLNWAEASPWPEPVTECWAEDENGVVVKRVSV